MAMESVALYSALLAFASRHLSLVDSSYEVTALETRSTALQNLFTAINTPSDQLTWHETNAAASLAFVIYEVGVGDCKSWYTHLKGTRNIIESTATVSNSGELLRGPEAFKTSPEGEWILRNFAYHDIIGSVTLRKKSLIDGNYLGSISDVVDSCLGVATELLPFIGHIIALDEDMDADTDQPSDESQRKKTDFQSSCMQLEQELQNWSCQNTTSPVLTSMAHAYRSAALILLYRLVRNKLDTKGSTKDSSPNRPTSHSLEAKVQAQVKTILHQVSEIPIGESPETGLLFPLFLAGGEAIEVDQIDSVRTRLKRIVEKRRFQNVTKALEVLEELWELRKGSHEESVDWTQILDANGCELLLT